LRAEIVEIFSCLTPPEPINIYIANNNEKKIGKAKTAKKLKIFL